MDTGRILHLNQKEKKENGIDRMEAWPSGKRKRSSAPSGSWLQGSVGMALPWLLLPNTNRVSQGQQPTSSVPRHQDEKVTGLRANPEPISSGQTEVSHFYLVHRQEQI